MSEVSGLTGGHGQTEGGRGEGVGGVGARRGAPPLSRHVSETEGTRQPPSGFSFPQITSL